MTRADWERTTLAPALARQPDRLAGVAPASGRVVAPVYTPEDAPFSGPPEADGSIRREVDRRESAVAGEGPGAWSILHSASGGTLSEVNGGLRRALFSGATAVQLAFDRATRLGWDPDTDIDEGAPDRDGVSLATVADMSDLLAGIDLRAVPVSLGVDGSAAAVFACLLVAAEQQGVAWASLAGSVQNDVLGEALISPRSAFAPGPSLRLVLDVVNFCGSHAPGIRPISVNGGRLRGAGATVQQELSCAVATAVAYADAAVRSGIPTAEAAACVSFAFGSRSQLFEEIAKLRAARLVWTRVLRERFGLSAAPSAVHLHVRTSGPAVLPPEPWENVARVSLEVLSAVLGGADSIESQSVTPSAADDRLRPAVLAVTAQRVLVHESGLAEHIDALGGSWFVERLTDDFVQQTVADLAAVDRMGGLLEAAAAGLPCLQCSARPAGEARRLSGIQDSGQQGHADAGGATIQPAATDADIDQGALRERLERVRHWRAARDRVAVEAALDGLRRAGERDGPVMPALISCARAGVTVGEMCGTLRQQWGAG